MRSRLRTKILLSVGCLILAVLGTSTFVHIQSFKRNFIEAVELRSEALVQGMVQSVKDNYKFSPHIESLLMSLSLKCIQLYDLNKEKGIVHLSVVNSAGIIVAHNDNTLWNSPIENPQLLAGLERRQRSTILIGTIYHTLIPMFGEDNRYLGSIDVGTHKYVVDEKIEESLIHTVELFIVSLLLSVLILSFLIHLIITKPIRQLVAVARKVARGELVQTIHIGNNKNITLHGKKIAPNEIGALVAAFYDMIGYLQDVARAATHIAEGDLSQEVSPRSENDVLGLAFQRMSEYLHNMASVATAIAEGDLRQEIQPASEHDVLGMAFHNLKSLRHMIRQIIEEAHKVRHVSESFSQISGEMASGAEQTFQRTETASSNSRQVSANMHMIASATEELFASIREISHNTSHVMNVVSIAVNTADTAKTKITDLETTSQEIGEIVKVITAITQQTNLLALNATIEASRAGEYGKGFTVVAHEIKELSREIAVLAEDIIHKVETMQVVNKDVAKSITDVSTSIHQAHDTSHSITTAVEEQANTTQEISRNISEASHGSSEVSAMIADVAAVTQETMKRAMNVRQFAEELATLSDQMHQLVKVFKI